MGKEVSFVHGPFYMGIETDEIEKVDEKGVVRHKYISYDGLLKIKHVFKSATMGVKGEEPAVEYMELLTLYTYPDIESKTDFKIKFIFPHSIGMTKSEDVAKRLPSRKEIYHISDVESFVYELDKFGSATMCYRFYIDYRLPLEEE